MAVVGIGIVLGSYYAAGRQHCVALHRSAEARAACNTMMSAGSSIPAESKAAITAVSRMLRADPAISSEDTSPVPLTRGSWLHGALS